ncbi:hypothetical protein D3C81_587190 [compost metagenome]
MPAEQGENPVGEKTDDHSGDQHADGRQQANRPAIAAQVGKVYMQGASEQQERQHPVHQQVVEIDLVHQALHAFFQAGVTDHAQALQQQREQQCGHHHADGRGQADKAVIYIGEEGGQTDKRSNELKHPRSCSGFQVDTR